jgi:hypothetical protein
MQTGITPVKTAAALTGGRPLLADCCRKLGLFSQLAIKGNKTELEPRSIRSKCLALGARLANELSMTLRPLNG